LGWLRRLRDRFAEVEPPRALLAGSRAVTRHLRADDEPNDWTITFSVGDYQNLSIDWPSVVDDQPVTREDVAKAFWVWLTTAPRVGDVPTRTVRARIGGRTTDVTFRTDWVAGINVAGGPRE
jgi:hypothetical protein